MFNFIPIKIKAISLIAIVTVIIYSSYCFIERPKMQLVVLYNNSPEIDTKLLSKMEVNYNGYNVGYVKKVKISKDRKYIELVVNITSEDLILPSNTTMTFRTKNFEGKRYLKIETPKKPTKQFLSNGDFIVGTLAYEEPSGSLFKEISSEKPNQFIKNLREMTEEIKISFENRDNKKMLDQSADDMVAILNNLKEVVSDPVFKKDVKPAMQHSCGYINSANKKAIKAINNKQASPIKENLKNINQTIFEANKELSKTSIFLTASSDSKSINNSNDKCSQTLAENNEKVNFKTNCNNDNTGGFLNVKTNILKLVFGNSKKAPDNYDKYEANCVNTTAKK